jgi:hypothetical protein
MHLHGMEVAPLAPLLIPLGELLVWAVALAVCLAVVYFAKAFFGLAGGLLGKLPVVGGWIDSGLTSIEHKIVSTMSSAAASCDAKVGAAFHQLARVIDWLGHEIAAHANLINTLATILLGQNIAAEIRAAIRAFHAIIHGVESAAHTALRQIVTLEKTVRRSIAIDVSPRVKSLEREVGRVVEHDIAGLRARERALEDGALHTFRWIKAHPGALASTAFAGAVAWAVGRLGMGWARCTNWNRIGRSVCGVPTGEIDALLGLLVGGAALLEFRELVKLAQSVEHGVASGLQDIAKL